MPASPAANDIGTTKEALQVPAFRRLLGAWTVANVGDSVLFLTIAIWVKTLTNSDVYTALIFVMLGLPALIAPVFGLLADRFSRIRVVSISNIFVAACVLLLLFVRDSSDMWLVYAVTFAYSSAGYVNASSQSGLLRDTIEVRLLGPANGTFTAIDQGLRIVAPLLAAGVFAMWGIEPILFFTAAMLLISTTLLQLVRIKETKNDVALDRNWMRTSLEGFPEMYQRKRLWTYLIAFMIIVATGGAVNAVIFPVIDSGLGLDAQFITIFTSVQGFTAVVAGLCGAYFMRRFGYDQLVLVSAFMYALAIAMLALPQIVAVALAFAILGFFMPLMGMVIMTIKQTELPLEVQGRSGAAMNMMLSLPQVITSAIAAAALGILPYGVIILMAAGISLLALIPLYKAHTDYTNETTQQATEPHIETVSVD